MNEDDFLIESEKWRNERRFLQQSSGEIEKTLREIAAVMRKAFLGLTAAGFTDDQAIDLIKARGPFLA